MRRKIVVVVFVILAFSLTTILTPEIEAQTKLQELENKFKQLEKERKQMEANQKTFEKNIAKAEKDITTLENEIKSLDQQIADKEKEIQLKEDDIQKTQDEALLVAQLLDEAIARVEQRDEYLKTRVRAMYEVGEVSYLDVLLNAQSIGDFLSRVDMVEKIVDSDKTILAENIADKEEIAERQLQVDAFLVQLNDEYAILSDARAELKDMMNHRTATIASLTDKIEAWDKEIEKLEKDLPKKIAELNKVYEEINKLKFNGELAWPVPDSSRITSQFGTRTDPFTKQPKTHNGLDIGAPQGTKIIAAAEGTVILAEEYGAYGYTVMIAHGSDVTTLYAHIRKGGIMVKKGDKVERGQKIAEVGSTGRSTGPHLHFGVMKNGAFVDPEKYLLSK